MKIILFSRRGLAFQAEELKLLRESIAEFGFDCAVNEEFAEILQEKIGWTIPPKAQYGATVGHQTEPAVLVCYGGDGTLLHASKAATLHGIPVLGVNIGTMGFMAELEVTEVEQLALLAKKEYTIEERMMIDVTVIRDGKQLLNDFALNDAVVTKGAVARVIQMAIYCDGTEAINFSGDGVIICTPTGSTAYSMSAGGPIVEPSAENMIITPVCAHTMQARPIVTAGSRTIEMMIGRIGRKNAFLSVDGGRAFRLNSGDVIRVTKSAYVTRLVRLTDKSFFEILYKKLK